MSLCFNTFVTLFFVAIFTSSVFLGIPRYFELIDEVGDCKVEPDLRIALFSIIESRQKSNIGVRIKNNSLLPCNYGLANGCLDHFTGVSGTKDT